MREKRNPIHYIYSKNNLSDFLEQGELIAPVNPFTQEGYVIQSYYYITSFGKILSFYQNSWRIIKSFPNTGGYLHAVLRTIDNRYVNVLVHRLVLSAFCPVENMYNLEVDHVDGNITCNRLDKLRWVDHPFNVKEAYRIGLKASLGEEKILNIYNEIKEAFPKNIDEELGLKYGVAKETIRSIRLGTNGYADILQKFNLQPIAYKIKGLTDDQIRDIMDNIMAKYPTNIDAIMADKYHVSESTILKIRSGGGDYLSKLQKLGYSPVLYPRTNDIDVYKKILQYAEDGLDDRLIASRLSMNLNTVKAIRTGMGQYGIILERNGLSPVKRNTSVSNQLIIDIMSDIKNAYPNCIDNELSEKYNISAKTILAIRTGGSIYGQKLTELGLEPIYYTDAAVITDDIIKRVIELAKYGYRDTAIAIKLNISAATSKKIRIGAGIYADKLKALGLDTVLYR